MRLFRHSPSGRSHKQLAETYSGTDEHISVYPLQDQQIGASLGRGKDGRYSVILTTAEAEWVRDRLNDMIQYQREKQNDTATVD